MNIVTYAIVLKFINNKNIQYLIINKIVIKRAKKKAKKKEINENEYYK